MTDDDSVDILPLLDELRVIGQNGLMDADSPYDRERNERLLELASEFYGKAIDVPPAEARERLAAELGYVTAKVGAGAAIFDDDGRLLLLKRVDSERWGFPAGGVEPNESAAAAAVRETREETGIEAQVAETVGVYHEDPGQSSPHSVVMIYYLCERTGGSLRPSHEAEAVRYWDIDDVPVWHSDARTWATDAYELWSERNEKQ